MDPEEDPPLDFARSSKLEVLLQLTDVDVVEKIGKAKNDTEFFKAVYLTLVENKKLPSKIAIPAQTKAAELSRTLRLAGDAEMDRDHTFNALTYYIKAVAAAPYPKLANNFATELSLAFGKRSMAYYEMKNYRATLHDIRNAFTFFFPEHLRFLLLERRAACYRKLQMHEKAKESYKEALECVRRLRFPPPGKEVLLQSTLEMYECLTNDDMPHPGEESPEDADPLHINRPRIPDSKACLDLCYSQKDLYRMVCTRDVKPGDVLVVQDPFAVVLYNDYHYTHCYYCWLPSDAMIPCVRCSLVMFCSKKCRKLCCDSFHRYECTVWPSVDEYCDYVPLFALKLLLVSVHSAGGSLVQLNEYVEKLERYRTEIKGDLRIHPTTQHPSTRLVDFSMLYFMNRQHRPISEELHPLRVDGTGGRTGDLNAAHLFIYAVNASLIVNLLTKRTGFFRQFCDREMNVLDKKLFVGGLLMRFMQIAEFHMRTVDGKYYDNDRGGWQSTQLGVAVYHGLSYARHSCSHNATWGYFAGFRAFIYANQPIRDNQEVFLNLVGEAFGDMNFAERSSLLSALSITCNCVACRDKWPTIAQMNTLMVVPRTTCFECDEKLIVLRDGAKMKCINCGTVRDLLRCYKRCTETGREKFHRLWDLNLAGKKKCKGLNRKIRKEIAKFIRFMFDTYEMPNVFVAVYQYLLDKHYNMVSLRSSSARV